MPRSSRWSAHSHAPEATDPAKYDRYCLAAATAAASSGTTMSTTPLGTCTDMGPTSSGEYTPSPPPSIMAGPPMPMFDPSVAMTTSQHPRMAALPAKQYPLVMPTNGTSPLSPPNSA